LLARLQELNVHSCVIRQPGNRPDHRQRPYGLRQAGDRVTNVSQPSLTVYSPDPAKDTHAAALVFPGGSYIRLSWSVEGTEVCDWLNSLGMTCILVKYRVPEDGHYPR